MEEKIVGIIIAFVGMALLGFRKQFTNKVIKLNNKGLGFTSYGEKDRKVGLWFVSLFGLLAIVLGVTIFMGVFELK